MTIGQYVWVPCEVKPGAFSDERIIRVNSSVGTWVGFVSVSSLRQPVLVGSTEATAVVVDVSQEKFLAQPVGQPLTNSVYEDLISRAEVF